MEEPGTAIIGIHCKRCLDAFHSLCDDLGRSDLNDTDQIKLPAVEDEYGRFKIWAGNIGAHRSGQVSLDHRLREAPRTRERVVNLLVDLENNLNDGCAILTGRRPPYEDEDPSDSESSEYALENPPLDSRGELQMIFIAIKQIVDLLYEHSIVIRNAAPLDKLSKAAKENVSHFQPWDTRHTRERFPQLEPDSFLLKRLLNANTRRRQLFKYLEKHQGKLSRGVLPGKQILPQNLDDKNSKGLHSHEEASQPEAAASTKSGPSINTTTVNTQTTIATFKEPEEIDAEDLDDDRFSETSSAASESAAAESTIPIPAPPKGALDNKSFQCPYCYDILRVPGLPSWRMHVLRDLQPYVCTFEHCVQPTKTYGSRHEWFSHEARFHRQTWVCQECQHDFPSEASFICHTKVEHSSNFAERQRQALLDLALRPARKNVIGQCPLCLREGQAIRSHLARHMRAHAFFALPLSISEEPKAKIFLGGVSNNSNGKGSSELGHGPHEANGTDGTRALDLEESDHSESSMESLLSDAVMEEHIPPAEKTMEKSEINAGLPPSLPMSTKIQLDESAQRPPPRPTSPYSHVDVLLLQWEDDDLMVDGEINELENVFATRCNFTTHRWSIPSTNPEDHLIYRILQFKRDKTEKDLLILYYGGHALGDPQECFWLAGGLKSPELNWHNVQYTLLGSPADVLLIFDCHFATLDARNSGTGARWFLGALAPFTSNLTREIDRYAHQYWTRNVKFTVQGIHHALTVWDRALARTPNLLRLTDHECNLIELTPLLYPQISTRMPSKTSMEPVDQDTHPFSPPPPYITNSYTTPVHNDRDRISERDPFSMLEHGPTVIELSPGETQTVRVQGVPLSADTHDLVRWFENRLVRASVITKLGPLAESPTRKGSKEAAVTFSSVALAMQALTIGNLDFQSKGRTYPRNITIDNDFTGLTCLYSSIKSPNRQPSIDIVLVHGAFGHALNSFASHYTEPAGEFVWPCEALARSLEEAGVYPRIMTFGWDADAWLDPHKGKPHSCNDLLAALRQRTTGNQMPLFFIGHGVGGFLVKEAVSETINYGFNFERFENPVKACFFFAVPNRSDGIDDGFPRLLANMRSALQNGVSPGPPLVRAFRGRNTAVSSLTQEFEEIRQEHGVKCLTFNGTRKTSGCVIVPPKQSTLDDNADGAFHFDLDYRDIMRLPMNEEPLKKVVETLVDAICHKLGTSSPFDGQIPPETALGKQKEKEKERIFGKLRSYDTVFLVDDSDSMYGRRWDTTKHVLAHIASIAVLHDKNGVDIRFFNEYLEDEQRLQLDSAVKVMNVFAKVKPYGSTPTADVLERELKDYVYEYRNNRHRKGLNLIILTDGEPDPGQDVEGVIVDFAKRLKELEAPLRHVGIQFVQIGGDKEAADFLATLANDLKEKYGLDRDMVDTVPWVAGEEERLYEKILLGGILSRYDDEDLLDLLASVTLVDPLHGCEYDCIDCLRI